MTNAVPWAGRNSWMHDRGDGPRARAVRARSSVPLFERAGPWRGLAEIAVGGYPGFVFGGAVGRALPVFHLHDTTSTALEGYCSYLVNNGYRTVTTDALVRFVVGGVHPGDKRVMLCFDDAWASVWTVAFPLLKRYGLQAVTFAIPFRTEDADAPRSIDDNRSAGAGGSPFATWPELRALASSGVVDVQSHSWSHSALSASDRVRGFLTSGRPPMQELEWPWASSAGRYLGPGDLGAPLFTERSRLSDGWRYVDDAPREACLEAVAAAGKGRFFEEPDWERRLRAVVERHPGYFESAEQRAGAIEEELRRSREELEYRLGSRVQHFCAPWGVAGPEVLAALPRCGYETAFSDRWPGRRVVVAGDPPFRLMRLHERYISCLPGAGRASFLSVSRG